MGRLTDTHCHLDFETFDDDRSAVISRAEAAGIERMLNPGIDLASSKAAVRLSKATRAIYAAVGVHPNSATTWGVRTIKDLRQLSQNPKVVAIGEIGLDYYRDRAPKDLQQDIFRQQLALAAEIGKPVVIHNRESLDDILEILAEWQADLVESGSRLAHRPGVLHSFSGNQEHAVRAMAHNFYIGITGPVTFKKALDLQSLVKSLPLEAILIETDAPFLSPVPRRGRRNEPANVQWVAEKIAALKGLDVAAVHQTTFTNAARLFGW